MAAPKCDRRDILGLLQGHFQSLDPDIASDDLHGFLDALTGLETPLDEPNATAFDRWRQKIAETGIPVWGYSQEQIDAIKRKGEELKAAEEKRVADSAALLIELAKEAPLVPVSEMLK